MTASYTFYKFPGLDARIGFALDGDRLAVAFLAQGCSRSGKPGAYVYKQRNPDKRKAQARLLEWMGWPDSGTVVAVRWGASGNPVERNVAWPMVRKLATAGGNYRLDLVVDLPAFCCVADVAVAHGLGHVDNRPVPVRWL